LSLGSSDLRKRLPFRAITGITFSLLCAGVFRQREKVTHAVGIKFIIEEKIFNLSGSCIFEAVKI